MVIPYKKKIDFKCKIYTDSSDLVLYALVVSGSVLFQEVKNLTISKWFM